MQFQPAHTVFIARNKIKGCLLALSLWYALQDMYSVHKETLKHYQQAEQRQEIRYDQSEGLGKGT